MKSHEERTSEFKEIAHSGGKITINALTQDGRRAYQQSYVNSRPNASAIIAVWALPQGFAIASANLGLGDGQDQPPVDGCYMVFIASDSHGKFGHDCAGCGGYWRSGPWPRVCPYCRFQDQSFNFLSATQRLYVAHYCDALTTALRSAEDGSFTIDMDAVADAAGQEGEKPAFYVSEETQQHQFICNACNEYNDVLGRFAYCSSCGTRNDLHVFRSDMISLRASLTSDKTADAVRSAISIFDNLVGQHTKQLVELVPLSKRRLERLKRGRFHDIEATVEVLGWFDIHVISGLSESDIAFLRLMFLRRHVYEHNGGEVDRKYIEVSGDNTVRLKQHISQTVAEVNRLINGLDRMAQRLHDGFHELIPALEGPIKAYRDRLARQAAFERGQ